MKKFILVSAFAISSGVLLDGRTIADPFDISTGTTTTKTHSLGSTAGETGRVEATGTLTVTSSNDAVDFSGNATVNNLGTINQTGSGRGLRDNTGNLTVTVTNGSSTNSSALIQTANNDAFQMNQPGSNVTMYNYGTVNSINTGAGGAQAIDWNAITTGSNTLYNEATGTLQAAQADAVRPGVNGVVYNSGTIKSTSGSSSDGIDAQTNSGITITNAATQTAGTGATNLIEGARHGITGGNTSGDGTYAMSITNNAGGTIQGDNGSGINIDGINGNELVTVINHGTITGDGVTADGDGVDVDGLVNITNTGTIKSLNAVGANSEGITVGGGTIVNSGLIEGQQTSSGSLGRGITLAGIDNAGPIQTIYGNTVVTNQAGGVIKGDSDSGIAIQGVSGTTAFTVTINNNAGATLEGGGATSGTLDGSTVGNNITVNNAGTITADHSNLALALGTGTNTVNITGGAAHVNGNIDGGSGKTTVKIDTGAGNAFNYAGTISHVSNLAIAAGSTFAPGGVQPAGDSSTNVANGNAILDTTGFDPGTGTTPNALATITSANLTFALGAGGAGSGSQFDITGGVANTIAFAGASTITINDLVGAHLTLNQEYVLIDGGNTTYTGLQLGEMTTLGQEITGGLNLATNDFSSLYGGSSLYLKGDNIVIEVAAVPEPGTWALGVFGLGGLALLHIRRKRARS